MKFCEFTHCRLRDEPHNMLRVRGHWYCAAHGVFTAMRCNARVRAAVRRLRRGCR